MARPALATAVALVLSSLPALADELEPIPANSVAKLAPVLLEKAAEQELAIRVEPDVKQANGWHLEGELGMMIVPQEGLAETQELSAQFDNPQGATLGYLFLHNVTLVRDGEKIDSEKLPAVQVEGETARVLTLTAKRFDGDEYRLLAFGSEKEPLLEGRFTMNEEETDHTVSLTIRNVDEETSEADLVVTVFGKYQASFRGAQAD